ncbi:MAG: ATP-binding protein [Elusimicrobiaceae bacterium]|nr:ATP-binding protein [Elusimicrobiaceae bacterium]
MIQRTQYLDKLKLFKDKQLIKVVTGVRRCGKSTLFKLFQNYLLETGVTNQQIQALNFEDVFNTELQDYIKLHQYIVDHAVANKKNYIFLDEIQNVPQFQKVVDSLYIRDNFDIYITGSNAHLLSGELATLLSGRYIEIQMLPLSFKEYVAANEVPHKSLAELYTSYAHYGSFPYTLQMPDSSAKQDYVKNILDSIIVKDVMARHKISSPNELYRIIKFLFDNIGSIVSIKKISDTMTSAGYKITNKTVEKYVTALVESFVLYPASRYDIKGKQYLQMGEKYYVVDTGLRQALLNNRGKDTGHILENIVYLELVRRGYKVFIGKSDTKEVDFVALSEQRTEYYQVSQSILAEETLKRELEPLQQIKDHYPKYLLTMDYLPATDFDGIQQINVLDWLVQDKPGK